MTRAYLESTITISLESRKFLLVHLDLDSLILPQPLDLIQYFRVAKNVDCPSQFQRSHGEQNGRLGLTRSPRKCRQTSS